ncbi:putative reverse transcriptase domain-containing protein, partial [Tanacetum coccineum]
LKQKLCSAPILALPEGSEDFIAYCDASKEGFGRCVDVISERILKSKRAKTSKNRQETEKTSTRERFEANFKSRIKTVVEERQESKEKDKSLKEKDHYTLCRGCKKD